MDTNELFDKSSSESSEGIVPEVNETHVEPQEPISQGEEKPAKQVEGTKEWFQSQVDKTVKKIVSDKEQAWAQREAEYQQAFQSLRGEIESIKNPPLREEVLTPPEPPLDPTDPLQVMRYQGELTDYRFKMLDKKFGKIDNIEKSIQDERAEKIQRQRYEANKAALLGKYQEAGLSAEEALECYQFGEKPEGVTPENIVALYKITKGIPITFKDNGKKVREKENFRLPPGAGGSGVPEATESQAFMNGIGNNKFTGLFDKK